MSQNKTAKKNPRETLGKWFTAFFLLLTVWMGFCIGRIDFACRLTIAAAVLSLFYTYLAVRSDRKWARNLCILYEVCLTFSAVVFLAVTIILNVSASRTAVSDNAPDAEYVIVFGAGVHGETPSLILKNRTKTACDYLLTHPTSRAILSGGMGAGERITEAEAMRRLLTGWGIDESRLILEDKASNTRENALYSRELMDSPTASVVAVSNAFHLRRCMQMLGDAGIYNVSTLSSPLPSGGTAASMYIRETVATIYHMIFD